MTMITRNPTLENMADALDSAAVDLRAGDGVKIVLARLLGIQRRHVDVSLKEPSSE